MTKIQKHFRKGGILDLNKRADLKKLAELFNEFDEDKNRTLDTNEVYKALKKVDEDTTIGWVYKMMDKFDKNHDERISFNEFKELYKQITEGEVLEYDSDEEEKKHEKKLLKKQKQN